MKKQRTGKNKIGTPAMASLGPRVPGKKVGALLGREKFLARWRRLATGLRGVRLFRVTLAVGGKVFWAVECTLSGVSVCRRFASELHARAWLSMAIQSRAVMSSVERQELDRPCSTSCFTTGG